MKAFIAFIAFQLLMAVTIAQITYTTAWFRGKRPMLHQHLEIENCQSNKLHSTIQYLINTEKALRESCKIQQKQLKEQQMLNKAGLSLVQGIQEVPPPTISISPPVVVARNNMKKLNNITYRITSRLNTKVKISSI